MNEIKFGFSSNISNAATLGSNSTQELLVYANGNFKGLLEGLNYFYLFIPYCSSFGGTEHSPLINWPNGVTFNAGDIIKDSKSETIYWTDLDDSYSGDRPMSIPQEDTYSYGYYTYKVLISSNYVDTIIQESISIKGYNPNINWILASVGEENYEFPVWETTQVTGKINILWDKSSALNIPVATNIYYYRVDKLSPNNTGLSLNEYKEISYYPENISDSYSFNNSSTDTLHRFKYILFRSNGTNIVKDLLFNNDCTWARLISVKLYSDTENKIYENVLLLEVDTNTINKARTGVLEVRIGGTTILNITLTLYGADKGDVPIIIPTVSGDLNDDEYKYWEINSTGKYSISDTNSGPIVDSTSLLFKSNSANVYLTIEQKDNTLFLGNYLNSANINKIHDIMKTYIDTDQVLMLDGARKISIKVSKTLNYEYIPDLTKNSLYKKLFKHGEIYILGLVFVYKTGAWSSVYYLGDTKGKYSPSIEPSLVEELIQASLDSATNTFYKKPVRYCILGLNLTGALSGADIIGVMPVYAVKNSHDVICLGFLSSTLSSSKRKLNEGLEALYSWFYRTLINLTDKILERGHSRNKLDVEILTLDSNKIDSSLSWNILRDTFTINTPEIEADESLKESMMETCKWKPISFYDDLVYSNNITATFNGIYRYSTFNTTDAYQDGNSAVTSITDRRFITGYLWKGFLNVDPNDNNDSGKGYHENDRLNATTEPNNYAWFRVYPWLRNKMGGEGPESQITNKRLFNSIYCKGVSKLATNLDLNPEIAGYAIYRDLSSPSIIKVSSKLYQGNVDYVYTTEEGSYKAWGLQGNREVYPEAHKDEKQYAGYDIYGDIIDPVNIKYKVSPHIVVNLNSKISYNDTDALFCVELYKSPLVKTDTNDLTSYLWIKCGDLKRIIPTEPTTVYFEEGDYFFGRFDSLRTYCYTELDVNSVVEVVSGMLCSRVNLDARTDRNRGTNTPTLSPTNFNKFNPIYNLLNNYFTFSYIDYTDSIYNRKYENSILWSLTKLYGSEIDDWCNIQDANTLDLDGDKGSLTSILKLGNNLIAFQDTGISLILYNEKTLIATTEGVPIEIANSGKVNGKFYLYDNIGCLNQAAITKSPVGLYFIDSINKGIYLLQLNGLVQDITTAGGMKSWALTNLDNNWWSYYDSVSLEILFTNELESLSYSDPYLKFNAFLGYGGIRWNFKINDKIALVRPAGFNLVISTTIETPAIPKRVAASIVKHNTTTNTFWKKNSINETKFFGNYSPIEVELNCNPEPTVDKTFSIVEYRADAFDSDGNYLPYKSFNTFRAWNEYLDTFPTSLSFVPSDSTNLSHDRKKTLRLRKKFRIWRIDIPRAINYDNIHRLGEEKSITDIPYKGEEETSLPGSAGYHSKNRIRNPWCKIHLSMDSKDMSKFVLNDIAIQYFK